MILRQILRAFQGRVSAAVHPSASLFPLQAVSAYRVDIGRLTKGIDNIHIDVRVSPSYLLQTRTLTTGLCSTRAMGKGAAPNRDNWEPFRHTYARLLEVAVHRAASRKQSFWVPRRSSRPARWCFGRLPRRWEARREEMKTALSAEGGVGPERLDITERLAWLLRNRCRLGYSVVRQVCEQLDHVERGSIGELCQSVLGTSELLPERVVTNSPLYAEGPRDEYVMTREYVLLGPEADPFSLSRIEALLMETFPQDQRSVFSPAPWDTAETDGRLAWVSSPTNIDW